MKFVDAVIEAIGWLKIFMSPFLAGLVIALIIYFNFPGNTGFFIAICIAVLGFVFGAVYATYILRTQGTNDYFTQLDGTPDLVDDNHNENDN